MPRTTDVEFKYGYSDDDESARVARGNVLEPQFNVRTIFPSCSSCQHLGFRLAWLLSAFPVTVNSVHRLSAPPSVAGRWRADRPDV